VKKHQHAGSRAGRSGNADPTQDHARRARTSRQGTQNILNSGNAPGLPDEIFFSVIQKKVISPNDFPSLGKLSETLLAFIDRYNQTAEPFNWKYTADDLKDLLRRISEHEKQDTAQQSDLTEAA
jgi:hypothetical protein